VSSREQEEKQQFDYFLWIGADRCCGLVRLVINLFVLNSFSFRPHLSVGPSHGSLCGNEGITTHDPSFGVFTGERHITASHRVWLSVTFEEIVPKEQDVPHCKFGVGARAIPVLAENI
jgi:hypothetical protein